MRRECSGLLKMLLQPAAIAALWRHRDLRLKLAHQSQLGGVGLVEVLHDFLLLLLTQDVDFPLK